MRCSRSPLFKTGLRVLQDGKWQGARRYGTVSEPSSISTPQSSVFEDALAATSPRNNWTKDEIKQIYETPLMKLAFASVSSFLFSIGFSNLGTLGHRTSKIPQPLLNPDVHPHEHQNRRLFRRLLLLRPIFTLQHRAQSFQNGNCRVRSRSCTNRKG